MKNVIIGEKKMKNRLPIFILIIIFVIGGGLMIYPDVSNFLASRSHAGLIQEYDEEVEVTPDPELERHLEKARAFNESLTGTDLQDPFGEDEVVLTAEYMDILNINGMIGYVEIYHLSIHLPIFHGTSSEVLDRGVGHMSHTAFPIGGEGTHAVLTGHTGLISARLFTNLEYMEVGDIFFITILDKRLAYQVDQRLVVWPHQTEHIQPVPGEDLVTLITCTPYGVNSHRLLLRGRRIPYSEAMELTLMGNAPRIINWRLVIILGFIPIFLLILIVSLVRNHRAKMRARREMIRNARARRMRSNGQRT